MNLVIHGERLKTCRTASVTFAKNDVVDLCGKDRPIAANYRHRPDCQSPASQHVIHSDICRFLGG